MRKVIKKEKGRIGYMENQIRSGMEPPYVLEQYLNLLKANGLVVDYKIKEENNDQEVAYLSYDSKEVQENTLFVCKGVHFSETYLNAAITKGAFCYVSETKYDGDSDYILVKDIRQTMALLANFYYNEPWRDLNLIGITGTKGKSTTAYFIRWILDHYLKRIGKQVSGILSGIDTYDGVIAEESHLTTPEAMMLQRHVRNAVDSGIEYMTMEVSSQALKYNRVQGTVFDLGCFLNIGEDHISEAEHRDFDDYFESKLMIFGQSRIACINLDMSHIEEVLCAAEGCARVITFGTSEKAEIYGSRIIKTDQGISFMVWTPNFEQPFLLTLPGLFNVENALAAIAVCYALEIPVEDMYEGLRLARVSGRMEVFENKEKKVTVIVDYAHNRLSFEKLYTSIREEYSNCHIVSIFGCPGGKAYKRRSELGQIAGRFAKKVYITEEDAGEEELFAISNEIADSVKAENCPFVIIEDRGECIRKAICEAEENTVILLTGKGRETRQKRGTQYVDCPSDVEYVEKYL